MYYLNRKKDKKYKRVLVLIFSILSILLVSFALFKYFAWTDKNIEYFVFLIKGKAVNVPFWLSAITAIVTNFFGLLFNIIVTIVQL